MTNTEKNWGDLIGMYCSQGQPQMQERKLKEFKQLHLGKLREIPFSQTTDLDFLEVLQNGGKYTQDTLKILQNAALDERLITVPILRKRRWPPIRRKDKRAITWSEHRMLTTNIRQVPWVRYLEVLWETGASQGDAANFRLEDIRDDVLEYRRQKTGTRAAFRLSKGFLEIVRATRRGRTTGFILPRIQSICSKDRSWIFHKHCKRLGVEVGERGVSLHSYRYAWAERAFEQGVSERLAKIGLGHNSSAIHHYYAKGASVVAPVLS